MKIKFLTFFGLAAFTAALPGAPVELKTPSVSLTVLPEKGGIITSLQSGAVKFEFSPEELNKDGYGLGKERIFGDNGEYIRAPWKLVSRTPRSAVLQVTGIQPLAKLEITKTYTLPEKGAYVRIDLKFRNTNPVAGSFKIVPWLHQGFAIPREAAGKDNRFYLSHRNGIETAVQSPKVILQPMIQNTGNWSAYVNPERKHGLLMVSAQQPEVLYDYIAPHITSMEMLFKAVDPVPEAVYTYYLAPVGELTEQAVAALSLPVVLNPALNAKQCPGDKVNLTAHFNTSTEKNIPVNFQFWKSAAWVSPDVTLPLTFGIRNIGGGKLEFEVDLPEFVSFEGHTGNYWWMVNEDMELVKKTVAERDGQKYTRCRFAVTARKLNEWSPNHYRVFLRAAKDAGTGTIYYRGFQNGKQIMENTLPCEVIRIPAARIPKHFKVLFGLDYSLWKNYPDFEKNMKHLGLNGLCFNYSVPNKVVSPDQVRAMNRELKKAGFMTAIMGIYFAPPFYLASPDKGREYKSIDVDGKPVNSFDFTVRGPWMKEVSENAVRKGLGLGFDLAVSDYEAYFGGERISFTPRTVAAFKQFFTKKHPGKPWVEPLEIARNPEKHPEHHKIWVDFKCDQYASYLEEVIGDARKLANETKIGWCTISGTSDESIRMDNLQDTARFASFLDYNMPMLYNNLYRTMPNYRGEIELFQSLTAGKKALLAPTLTIGFWQEGNPFPPEHSFYILLETALLQCPGAYIFPGFAGSDNLGVKYVSEAMNLIAEIEPLVEGAKRTRGLVTVSEARNTALKLPVRVHPLCLVNRNKALVYLADYSLNPVSMNLQFQLPGRCTVKSLTGPAFSGVLNNGETRPLTLTRETGKGILLLLEAADGMDFPVMEEKQSDAVSGKTDESGLLFYEPFDGSTRGKNLYDKHFYVFDAKGMKGKCLLLRDYESGWILPEKFDVKSGDMTIDFFFKNRSPHLPGSKMHWDILRGNLEGGQIFWLFLDPASGKMIFTMGKQNGNKTDWNIRLSSGTDRWPADIWQHIRLNFGKSGIRLMIDGREEIASPQKVFFRSMENFQLGRRWVSTGYYDELRVFDGLK
ncbi:MAG: hypothetical protein BWY31_00548 [Lentisphaerae bacterium ADurb.Bin242]|nr:MAG: hypothetical protein BWY31_00548 [Lentisphaerae bacterium ADurb.Bin242]